MKYLILGTALALALPLAGNVSVAKAQDAANPPVAALSFLCRGIY
jgi:hypothetical protein